MKGTGSSVVYRSRNKGKDFLPLTQPVIDALLEYRSAIPRAQALAMNDAHAAQLLFQSFVDEFPQGLMGLGKLESVEVDLGLDAIAAPFQAAEITPRQLWMAIAQWPLDISINVEERRCGWTGRRRSLPALLLCGSRWFPGYRMPWRKRADVIDGGTE